MSVGKIFLQIFLLSGLAILSPAFLYADSFRHSQSYSVSGLDRVLSSSAPRSLSRSSSGTFSRSSGLYGSTIRSNTQLLNAGGIQRKSNVLSGGNSFVGAQGFRRLSTRGSSSTLSRGSGRSTLSHSRSTLTRTTSSLSRGYSYSGTRRALR